MNIKSGSLRMVLMLVLIASSSCFRCKYEINYEQGEFPGTVVNFQSINTEYDDYNSTAPAMINLSFPLIFSTNRLTKGENYDLVDYTVWVSYDQTTGDLQLSASPYFYPYYYLTELANTTSDEFGPINGAFGEDQFLFCFASNRTDKNNMEIYVSYWDATTFEGVSPYKPDPFRLQGVNSPKYDAYPSFTADFSKMIFCSNRDGELDFYTVDLPEADDIYTWIKREDTTYAATPVDILNSPGKDVCPLINNQVVVFASDREGGFGGYDLYYAEVTADGFGEPVNFGSGINTEHNEYRPIILYASNFSNDLLIFSSDRPGGKGGYDLYYVGVDRMTIK